MTDAQLDEDESKAAAGLSPEDLQKLESVKEDLVALASLPRLRVLHLATRPQYAEELATALGVSRQAAIKHASRLEERGFVRAVPGRRASGPVVEYLVVPSKLFAFCVALSELANLQPGGGPRMRVHDPTIAFDAPSRPSAPSIAHSPHLLVVNGPRAGSRLALGPDQIRWTIGRDDDRHLRIEHDPFVSSHHAEIQTEWQGRMLVDVFSANGTFLNFQRLPTGGRASLRSGDLLGFGHTMFVYQENAPG